MTQNNNFSVLPWYLKLDEQNHRKSYSYGDIYPLFTPLGNLLPFQIQRATRENGIVSAVIYNRNGRPVMDFTDRLQETGLRIVRFPELGYDIIVYPGNINMYLPVEEGMYYAAISDGTDTFYSEIFTWVSNTDGYLKVEWHDEENLVFDAGQIVYENPSFRNVIYLCAELGKPDYYFDEDGETRDGYYFNEKQISEKTYKFNFLAPEYLCDVMRFIRMSDFVTVTDKYGRRYHCDTFLITPKWETQGNLASVECEFQTDTVVKKIGRALHNTATGDYNNDFNNDFLI